MKNSRLTLWSNVYLVLFISISFFPSPAWTCEEDNSHNEIKILNHHAYDAPDSIKQYMQNRIQNYCSYFDDFQGKEVNSDGLHLHCLAVEMDQIEGVEGFIAYLWVRDGTVIAVEYVGIERNHEEEINLSLVQIYNTAKNITHSNEPDGNFFHILPHPSGHDIHHVPFEFIANKDGTFDLFLFMLGPFAWNRTQCSRVLNHDTYWKNIYLLKDCSFKNRKEGTLFHYYQYIDFVSWTQFSMVSLVTIDNWQERVQKKW